MTESATATGTAALRAPAASLVSYTHWMYALHAFSAAIGLFGSAFIITAFVFGMPSIIAVVMNYVRRSDARGTTLESHFAWQLHTFWTAMLWGFGIALVSAILAATLILLPLAAILFFGGMFGVGLWVIYRIARGWLRLRDGQPP
jgi:uncharacterized membrane protein